LSDAGRKVHDEIAPLALGIEADLLHGLTAEQIETLNTVIERLLIRARLISAP
jgi:DNA-binding MarR family transcriptional regulator